MFEEKVDFHSSDGEQLMSQMTTHSVHVFHLAKKAADIETRSMYLASDL